MEPFGFEVGSAPRADLVRPPQGGRGQGRGFAAPSRSGGRDGNHVPTSADARTQKGVRKPGSMLRGMLFQVPGLIPAPVPAPVPEPVAET